MDQDAVPVWESKFDTYEDNHTCQLEAGVVEQGSYSINGRARLGSLI